MVDMGFFGPPGQARGTAQRLGRGLSQIQIPGDGRTGVSQTGHRSGTFQIKRDAMTGQLVVVHAPRKKKSKGFRMPRLYADMIRSYIDLARTAQYNMIVGGHK